MVNLGSNKKLSRKSFHFISILNSLFLLQRFIHCKEWEELIKVSSISIMCNVKYFGELEK